MPSCTCPSCRARLVYQPPTGVEPEVAFDKLAGLDLSGIVELLQETGCRGERTSSATCPLAIWLRRTVGGAWRVGSAETGFWANYHPAVSPQIQFDNSAAMNSFVAHFDEGNIPSLEIEPVAPSIPSWGSVAAALRGAPASASLATIEVSGQTVRP